MTCHCITRKRRAGSGKRTIGRRDRNRKAGTKKSNSVSEVGKEQRKEGREREREKRDSFLFIP